MRLATARRCIAAQATNGRRERINRGLDRIRADTEHKSASQPRRSASRHGKRFLAEIYADHAR